MCIVLLKCCSSGTRRTLLVVTYRCLHVVHCHLKNRAYTLIMTSTDIKTWLRWGIHLLCFLYTSYIISLHLWCNMENVFPNSHFFPWQAINETLIASYVHASYLLMNHFHTCIYFAGMPREEGLMCWLRLMCLATHYHGSYSSFYYYQSWQLRFSRKKKICT